jgi:hypothetical protein
MKTMTCLLMFAVAPIESLATQIAFRDLTNLVNSADHVLVGTVTNVTMIDRDGHAITDDKARTGPGLENEIRLHVKIGKADVLASNATNTPDSIVIPLWQLWHFTLGQIRKDAEGKSFIFLLKGPDYQRVYEGLFFRELSERDEIARILNEKSQKRVAGSD